ncbi:MAG: dephospho-CoA kinase [Lachnospiraceae bacterium]|nr:dephospho-CoA kinase [Lachnospiraceae bacterium]
MKPTDPIKTKVMVIGITGGVGAGKSSVLSILEKVSNCRLIIADEVAKKLQEPGERCFEELVSAFGEKILDEKGRIDKACLAKVIFDDPEARDRVNSIIHPAVNKYITDVINDERKKNNLEFLFIEAALLIECGYDSICDELWYVYAAEDTRRKRLKETRGYSDEKISSIFISQLPEEEFRKHCAEVIDNDADESAVKIEIEKLICKKRREFGFGEC